MGEHTEYKKAFNMLVSLLTITTYMAFIGTDIKAQILLLNITSIIYCAYSTYKEKYNKYMLWGSLTAIAFIHLKDMVLNIVMAFILPGIYHIYYITEHTLVVLNIVMPIIFIYTVVMEYLKHTSSRG